MKCPHYPKRCKCPIRFNWHPKFKAGKVSKSQDLMKALNKELKTDAVRMGGDPDLTVEYLPTGVIPIDVLLKGGLPRGRWVEMYGDYSTLKSYISLRALASVQQQGGIAGLIDTEHAYDPDWFRQQGGNPDELILQQPPTGEDAVASMEFLLRSQVDLVVWDSIAATAPQAEVSVDPRGKVQPARLAALMSEGLRRLNAANRRTAILCINQTRTMVGIVFGSSESIPGGKALPFYASYRISLRKAGKITEDGEVWDGTQMVKSKRRTAIKIRATLEKSKLNAPDREAWMVFDLRTGQLDDLGFLMAQGLEHGYINRDKGKWSWADPYDDGNTYTEQVFRDSTPQEDWEWLKNELMCH